jgi:hypothetical protein
VGAPPRSGAVLPPGVWPVPKRGGQIGSGSAQGTDVTIVIRALHSAPGRPAARYAAAAVSSCRARSSSSISATARFSSRCRLEDVPGINTMLGANPNVQASAT